MKPVYSTKNTIIGVSIICVLIGIMGAITISYLESIDAKVISNQEQINSLSKEIHNSENRITDKLHALDKQSLQIKNEVLIEIRELKKDGWYGWIRKRFCKSIS